MGLGRVTGHPDYSATGTSKFIPEIWSGKLVVKFYDATVLAAISNTDYEGEIHDHGDKVIIRTRGTVSIKKYIKGMKLDYERLESPATELLIDQGNYWGYIIDDVDHYQSDLNLMDQWAEDATEQEKIVVDTEILAGLKAQANTSNKGGNAGRISASYNLGGTGNPVELTKINVLDYIVDTGTVLDEQNIPESSRFMVIPAWMAGMIKKSDIKDASLTGDGKSLLRNGRIGVVDRFTLYSSNLLAFVSDTGANCFDILFGHPLALTFASQFVKTGHIPEPESTFGQIVRGLHVYGSKVIKGEGLGCLYAKKG